MCPTRSMLCFTKQFQKSLYLQFFLAPLHLLLSLSTCFSVFSYSTTFAELPVVFFVQFQVSQPYVATLHTKAFINLFLTCRLMLWCKQDCILTECNFCLVYPVHYFYLASSFLFSFFLTSITLILFRNQIVEILTLISICIPPITWDSQRGFGKSDLAYMTSQLKRYWCGWKHLICSLTGRNRTQSLYILVLIVLRRLEDLPKPYRPLFIRDESSSDKLHATSYDHHFQFMR